MGERRKSGVVRLVVDSSGDQEVHYGPSALVADLVAALFDDPDGRYLRSERTGRVFAPDLPLISAGLCSGDEVSIVEVAQVDGLSADQQLGSATATLQMLAGSLRGALYSLTSGTTTIGRVASNDIVIVEPGISREHAIVTIDTTTITIVDNGSTNGVKVNGELITEPTQVESGKPILVGNTLLAITHQPPLELIAASGSVAIERPVREIHRFDEQTITLPVPPEAASKKRRGDLLGSGRGRQRLAVEHFHASVAAIDQRLSDGRATEITSRFYEAPSISEILAGGSSHWRLWERKALDPDGLEVRLGIGSMPSRTTLSLPAGGDPELRAVVAEIPERYRTINKIPAVVDFRRYGSIGLSGPADPVDRLASSMVGQLVWFHGPDQLGLTCAPGSESGSWDWLKWLPHLVQSDNMILDGDAGFVRWLSAILDGRPTSFIDPAAVVPQGDVLEPQPRPPAIVVILDRTHKLPSPLLTRLLQEGPALGVYTLALAGDQPDSATALGAEVSLGVETANIDAGPDEHIGGVTVESVDHREIVGLARMLSPIRYADQVLVPEGSDSDDIDADTDDGPEDGIVVLPFRLLGEAIPGTPEAAIEPAVVEQSEPEPAASDSDPKGGDSEPKGGDSEPEVVAQSDESEATEPEPEESQSEVDEALSEHDAATVTGEIPAASSDSSLFPTEASPEPAVEPTVTQDVPAAPTMPQRTPDPTPNQDRIPDETPTPNQDPTPNQTSIPTPHRLVQTLPHGNDPGRLMLGTIHTGDEGAPAVFAWNMSRDGSLGLIGAPGAGKTSALRSVVASAALLRIDAEAVPLIYYLDVRGQLESIGALVNCIGAVRNDIDGFRAITAELDDQLYQRAAAGAPPDDDRDRNMLVLIDDVGAYIELMDSLDPGRAEMLLRRLVDDGPDLGIHLVATVENRSELSDEVASSIGRWLTIGATSTAVAVGDDGQPAAGAQRPGVAKIGKNEIRFAPLVDSSTNTGADTDIEDGTETEGDQIAAALETLASQLDERGVTGRPESS